MQDKVFWKKFYILFSSSDVLGEDFAFFKSAYLSESSEKTIHSRLFKKATQY